MSTQTNGQVNRVPTALEKTKEERMKELETLLVEAKAKADMPEDVRKIVDCLSGQTFKLGTKNIVEVPPSQQWGGYEAKNGKLKGEMVYTCLGRFAPIAFGNVGKRHISIQVQISILPIKD